MSITSVPESQSTQRCRAVCWPLLSVLLLTAPSLAMAHGANPQVTAILFPAPLGGEPLLVTDNQGAFGFFGAEPRWLCDDAVAPSAAFVTMVATATPGGWTVVSDSGVHVSSDDACSFERSAGLPTDVVPGALSAHPRRPDDLVMVAGVIAENPSFGVYRSQDGGRTFDAAQLVVDSPWTSLVRDPEAGEVLYLSGNAGAFRSDDAGGTWTPLTVSLADHDEIPVATVHLLAVRPGAGEIWAQIKQFPSPLLIRSTDQGQAWELIATLIEPLDRLVFDATGARALASSIFGSLVRSDAPETTWETGPSPAAGFGCLTRGPDPEQDTLFACAYPYLGAPWIAGRSDDFGRTWQPILPALQTVTDRWACEPEAHATQACADMCPGLSVAECDAANRPMEDAGMDVPDVGTDDVAVAPDVPTAPRKDSSSCQMTAHSARSMAMLWPRRR